MTARHIVLGHVSGLFGVSGWVKIFSHTRPIDNILGYSTWYVGAEAVPYRVITGRQQGKSLVARLGLVDQPPIDDRETAAALVDAPIAVPRSDMAEPPAGEYYWCDLIGLDVYNRDDAHLGHVTDMLATGANDVLVLGGERERLIPFVVGELVDDVDIRAGRIRVDWPTDA